MLIATVENAFASLFGSVIVLGFIGFIVCAAVWFFRGPAKATENYVNGLALSFQNPQDASLFRQIYTTKGPKSTTAAWLLSVFLSPSISYVYQGKWGLAVISFVTLQGLFIWYFVAIFTMPFEVVSANKKLADEAFQQVSLSRGGFGMQGGQQIIIHQQAYMPHPVASDAASVAPSGNPVTQAGHGEQPATVTVVPPSSAIVASDGSNPPTVPH